jgi:DNA-binding transcriptional regulator GbsR (MarR family)
VHVTQRLSPAATKFIVHWGEMGARWGLNRTVAQIHALLYVSKEALSAEEIAETLSVARSNVSTSLRELQGWGVVTVAHVLGDRRDRFQTFSDVWEMFRAILDQRKRREVDPAIDRLRECVVESTQSKEADPHVTERLRELLDFFETMTAWYEQVHRLPRSTVQKVIKLGHRVSGLLDKVR